MIDIKIAGRMSIQQQTLDECGYVAYLKIQEEIREKKEELHNIEAKIDLVREAISIAVLKSPEKKEIEIQNIYQPRLVYFEEKRKEKVNLNEFSI